MTCDAVDLDLLVAVVQAKQEGQGVVVGLKRVGKKQDPGFLRHGRIFGGEAPVDGTHRVFCGRLRTGDQFLAAMEREKQQRYGYE